MQNYQFMKREKSREKISAYQRWKKKQEFGKEIAVFDKSLAKIQEYKEMQEIKQKLRKENENKVKELKGLLKGI